jgi:drug/metabolite transporter (DMT)-like permease
MGQVITVVPVVSVSPVISFLLGYFIFRKERFTARIVIAIVLIVPAIVIIARSN